MNHAEAGNENPRENAPPLPPGWLGRWPWATFVVPFLVFGLMTMFEPKPPAADEAAADSATGLLDGIDELESEPLSEDDAVVSSDSGGWLPAIEYRYYPLVYTAKIVLTLIAMIAVWPGYRTFPFRVSGMSIIVGVVGAVIWVGLCKLRLEPKLLGPLGLGWLVEGGERSAFNPLEEFAQRPALAYGFLAIRLIGLALIVPVIEEFFLRGFLMRFVVHDLWHQVPFGTVNRLALVVGTMFPIISHPPSELLAVAVWFSLVSWLMVRTRNIWDCVAAHAVTNGLLGAWVIYSGDWWLM